MGTSDVGDQLPGLDDASLGWNVRSEDARKKVPISKTSKSVRGPTQARIFEDVSSQDQQLQEEKEEVTDSTEVVHFADKAMYEAAPMETTDLQPKVYLIWMTPDPLGAVAAMSKMYEGQPVYSLLDVTDREREHYWQEMTKTHLNAPLESVKMHFMIEGVDRAFTHQLVRQRTAVYAQESLRFAVKTNLADETPKPPSFTDNRIYGNKSGQNDLFDIWDHALSEIEKAYKALIAAGVPAEDARGLLPQATTTRIHYVTDLRNLLEHAGNRMCTQAQFHWRVVFTQIKDCIRNYWRQMDEENLAKASRIFAMDQPPDDDKYVREFNKAWQFELIADSSFVPQCYLQGKCTFRADFDRGCTIRGRVDHFARRGVPSSEWGNDNVDEMGPELAPIAREEWLLDAQAGWVR